MAQHDYNIANQSRPAFRADLNNAFSAIVSNNSGTTAPAPPFAYMWWYDTSNNILKQRNGANAAWIEVGYFDQANGKFVARIHETVSKTANYPVAATDRNKTILANATSAPITISVLAAATAGNGFIFTVKKTDASANTVTIDFNGTETGDGSLTKVLAAQYAWATFISDGTNWNIISPSVGVATTSASGTVTKATSAQVASETADVYADAATMKYHQGALKAWVNFTSVTTTTILDSYGVSSLTDNGVGDTTINWSTAFANANYAWTGTCQTSSIVFSGGSFTPTTGALRVRAASTGSNTATDTIGSVFATGDI